MRIIILILFLFIISCTSPITDRGYIVIESKQWIGNKDAFKFQGEFKYRYTLDNLKGPFNMMLFTDSVYVIGDTLYLGRY